MTVSFGDAEDAQLTGAQSGMKDIVEKKRLEMSLESAEDIEAIEGEEGTATGTPAPPPEEGASPGPEGTAP